MIVLFCQLFIIVKCLEFSLSVGVSKKTSFMIDVLVPSYPENPSTFSKRQGGYNRNVNLPNLAKLRANSN